MALIGSGKGYSKKDINFFEEYTAAARRTARYLAYFIFAALVVIAIFVIWWVIAFIQNNAIKKDIQALNDRINSEEFAEVEQKATQLEAELAKKNQQLYAISVMRNTVDTKTTANSALLDLLLENIPKDTYIDRYELNGDTFTIEGTSFTYYGAENMVAMLQDKEDVFNSDRPTTISINRVNDVNVQHNDGTVDPIDCYYEFKVVGHLTNNVNVSISSYANTSEGVVALGAIQNMEYKYGESYSNNGITSITYNGVDYSLTSIKVNGHEVGGEVLAEILATGTHNITNLTDNTSITYYYSVAVAATSEGGEA